VAIVKFASSPLRPEVFRSRMMHDNRRRPPLQIEEESRGHANTDAFFGMQQREEFRLIFEVRTRGIAEAVTRAAICISYSAGS